MRFFLFSVKSFKLTIPATNTMTSPAIKSNDKTPKTLQRHHPSTGDDDAGSTNSSATPILQSSSSHFPTCGLFSWLRVFRFADLLMRQGC